MKSISLFLLLFVWLLAEVSHADDRKTVQEVLEYPLYQKSIPREFTREEREKIIRECRQKIDELKEEKKRLASDSSVAERKREALNREAREIEKKYRELETREQELFRKTREEQSKNARELNKAYAEKKRLKHEYDRWREVTGEDYDERLERKLEECDDKIQNIRKGNPESDRKHAELSREKKELENRKRNYLRQKKEIERNGGESTVPSGEEANGQAHLQRIDEEIKSLEREIQRVQQGGGKNGGKPSGEPFSPKKPPKTEKNPVERQRYSAPETHIDFGLSDELWKFVVYVLGGVIVLFIAFYIGSWLYNLRSEVKEQRPAQKESRAVSDHPLLRASDLPDDLELLCREERYLDACRLLLKKSIVLLHERQLLPNKSFLTNLEFLRLIKSEQVREPLAVLFDAIERGYYACRVVTKEDYEICKTKWEQMNTSLSKARN